MTRSAVVLGVLAITATATARAQPREAPTEIELDRAESPAGRTELGFDSGAPLRGVGVTLGVGWIERALTFERPEGDVRAVRRRQTGSVGAAVALGASAVFDARLAFSHQVGDRLRGLDAGRALDRWVPGDLRIGARLNVVERPSGQLFVRGDLTLPTGDSGDFAGEPSWSVAWRLIARANLPGGAVAAASAGVRFRGEEVIVADRLVGNEIVGAIGIAVPLPPLRPLWCVAEQVKLTAELTGVLGDDVGLGRGPSPVQGMVGVVTRPRPSITFGVRAGVGVPGQIGAPPFRALVELTYGPPAVTRSQDRASPAE